MSDMRSVADAPVPAFECPAGRWWACALVGLVFFLAGLFILFNVVAASVIGALFFAAAIAVAGGFQIVHAFSSRGWGSFVLSLIVGVLFVIGGVLLAVNPLATSLGITLGFAAVLIATGVFRAVVAFRHWGDQGWLLLASGLIAIATGLIVFLGFPWSGLVVPGLLIGIDFLFQGMWWMVLGAFIRRPSSNGLASAPPRAAAV
jgi:uncharacterized membrane protein HdeD (DUF308 family)